MVTGCHLGSAERAGGESTYDLDSMGYPQNGRGKVLKGLILSGQ
jgi:hypothetical protein